MGLGHYEIDEDMSQRLSIMKFIFMICVVFIHSYALPNLGYALEIPQYVSGCKEVVVNGICRVAVPGFFFISGLLLFSKRFTWLGNLKRKVKSIGIPYLLINSFWILFFITVYSVNATAHLFADEAYQISGWRDVLEAYFDPIPLYYPFWFLRDLMILNVFAGMIRAAVDQFPLLTALILAALQMNVISLSPLLNNNSLVMFAFGAYFVKYGIDAAKADRIRLWYVGVFFIGMVLTKLYLGERQRLLFLIYAVCGIWLCWQIAGKIRKSRMAERILWCSQFTFFIFAFHEFYMAMAKRILMTLLPQYGMVQLLEFFMLPLVVSAICIVVGAFMKKKIPWLYRVACGLR